MSSPMATPLPPPTTASSPPYDRLKAVKDFEETKAGVKGLLDSGIKTIPSFFIHPPEILSDHAPGSGPELEIPTIDLSAIHDSRASVVDQIRSAASTFGFFQVINHGVSPELLRSVIGAIKAFHEQPAEVKAQVYRRELDTGVSYMSNVDLFTSKAASWRDTLQIKTGPVAPEEKEIPEVCRKEVMEWDREVVRIGDILLGLLSEGLGLGEEGFKEMGLSQGRMMVGNYYPFCPQPNLTVGLKSHADPGALTILVQDHIGGLQVRTQQGWVHVKPLDGALVINIGDLLQIISNEEYKSADHRVLANSSNESRVSSAFFLVPGNGEKLFGPLPELTSAEKPALYREFTFNEFLPRFYKKELDGKALTDFFRR